MLKRFLAVLLLLSLALSVAGCAAPSAQVGAGFTVTDALGYEVTLPKEPQRVAVLFSSFADIWVSAGGTVDITVGESVTRGFAGEEAVLVDGGAGKTIDLETLIAAEPDLVICSADIEGQADAAQICRDAGIPTAAFRVESFEDYLEVLDIFTQLTCRPDRYQVCGTEVAEKIRQQRENFLENSVGKTVLFIRAGSSAKYTKAKGSQDHFVCQMLQELGTVNIADAAPVLLDGLSFEEILTQDPEYIFISTMGDVDAAVSYMDSLLQEPQWQALSAVQNGKVFYLPKELFQFKPNARWDEAYAYLIDLLNQ